MQFWPSISVKHEIPDIPCSKPIYGSSKVKNESKQRMLQRTQLKRCMENYNVYVNRQPVGNRLNRFTQSEPHSMYQKFCSRTCAILVYIMFRPTQSIHVHTPVHTCLSSLSTTTNQIAQCRSIINCKVDTHTTHTISCSYQFTIGTYIYIYMHSIGCLNST